MLEPLGRIFIECLKQSSIDKIEEVLQLTVEPSWMDLIIQYLTDGTLSMNPQKSNDFDGRPLNILWWMIIFTKGRSLFPY